MVQDPLHELLDLAAVHKFYMQLLERNMGHPVPVPKEASHPDNAADQVQQSIVVMHRWLRLCDMAITSHMMRDELQQHERNERLPDRVHVHHRLASPLAPVISVRPSAPDVHDHVPVDRDTARSADFTLVEVGNEGVAY